MTTRRITNLPRPTAGLLALALLGGCTASKPTTTAAPAAAPGVTALPSSAGGAPALALIDRISVLPTVTRDQLLAGAIAVKMGTFPPEPEKRAEVARRLVLADEAFTASRLTPATNADLAAVLVRAAEGYADAPADALARLQAAGVIPAGAAANAPTSGPVTVAGLIALADRLAANEAFPGGPERPILSHRAEAAAAEEPIVTRGAEPTAEANSASAAPAAAAVSASEPAPVATPAPAPAAAPAAVAAAAPAPAATPAAAPEPAPTPAPMPVPAPVAAPAPAPKPNPWTPGTPIARPN